MATRAAASRRGQISVYTALAALFVLIGIGGFLGTYWLQVAAGTFTGSHLLHLHGLLFSMWTLFLLAQTVLVQSGQTRRHREWGVFGFALATAMLFTGVAVGAIGLNQRIAAGYGDAARASAIIPLTNIMLFGALVTAAIFTVKRPETHKRLMIVATLAILQAPVARLFAITQRHFGPGERFGGGPPKPLETTLPAAGVVLGLLALAMVLDWRARGRVHPAYLTAGGVLTVMHLTRIPLSTTPEWRATADFFAAFTR